VFDGGQDGSLFILVNSTVVKVCIPVQLEQINQLVLMDHLAHAGFYLGLIQVLVVLPWLFTLELKTTRLKPCDASFESAQS